MQENMIEKLRRYVENLFLSAPNTMQVVEIKEEILQNTIDRYNDLIHDGKSEDAAFNISVAGIGDVNSLIHNIMAPKAMSGYTKEEIMRNKKRNAILLSVSIMLYILCVVPVIVLEKYEVLGVTLMFVMAAIATALIIYRSGTTIRYDKTDDTVVENFKEWNYKKNENNAMLRAVDSVVWAVVIVTYFLLSFYTGAWYITWVIFVVGVAITNIVRAIFDLKVKK